jgi:hypothetical protein
MPRHMLLVAALLGITVCGVATQPRSAAADYSSYVISSFYMTTTVRSYPQSDAPSRFTAWANTYENEIPRHRWNDPAHTSRVSFNLWTNYSIFESAEIPAHSSSFYNMWDGVRGNDWWRANDVVFRGRTLCCTMEEYGRFEI